MLHSLLVYAHKADRLLHPSIHHHLLLSRQPQVALNSTSKPWLYFISLRFTASGGRFHVPERSLSFFQTGRPPVSSCFRSRLARTCIALWFTHLSVTLYFLSAPAVFHLRPCFTLGLTFNEVLKSLDKQITHDNLTPRKFPDACFLWTAAFGIRTYHTNSIFGNVHTVAVMNRSHHRRLYRYLIRVWSLMLSV